MGKLVQSNGYFARNARFWNEKSALELQFRANKQSDCAVQ